MPAEFINRAGEDKDRELRFSGTYRLYGKSATETFKEAHVLVVGVGGVGSWVVEALVRTGIGRISMVDFDDVCVSNTNRQSHATSGNTGAAKVAALHRRCLEINPYCRVQCFQSFYDLDTEPEIFAQGYSGVVDCIDQTLNKEWLAIHCRKNDIPLVVVGSAGGLRDPSLIRSSDLSRTLEDTMLSNMRKNLRQKHGFPRGKEKFGIPAVFSMESPSYVDTCGAITAERPKHLVGALDCAGGLGSAMVVTCAMAMYAVDKILEKMC